MKLTRFHQYLKDVLDTVYTEQPWICHEQIVDNAVAKYLTNHNFKDVLDVGCGYGYTLNKFKDMGMNAIGITLDKNEYQSGKEKGLDVRAMDMAFLDFDENTFDLVWCRHAIEHSIMPYIALREFNTVLRDSGYLYIEIPGDASIHVNNTNHYSMLSDLSWQVLFRKTGFMLLDRSQYALTEGETEAIYLYWAYWLKKGKT